LDEPAWSWVRCDLDPDHPIWQPLFDILPTSEGGRRRRMVCGAVDDIDAAVVWSRIGAGFQDTIDRCRRSGPAEVHPAALPTRADRAPCPAPALGPAGADGTAWDGREGLPGGWWRLPHDIRLQVRTLVRPVDGLMLSTDLHDGFAQTGPSYVD